MEKERVMPLIPFILALGVSLATMPPWNTLTYDGALYLDIARNLANDITSFTYQEVYMMYRPPLYPYTLSLFYHFVPEEYHLLVARLVSAFFFSFTAVLVYLLARDIFGDERRSIIASLFFISNPLAFTMATRELVHSEFTFFYTLAVYLLYTGRKKRNVLRIYISFIAAGLAILTRYTGLSIVVVFLVYLYLTDHWKWVKKREYWIGLILLAFTLAPWLYMGHIYYGGIFRPFSVASRVVTLDRPISVLDYINMLLKDLGYLLPALTTLGFVRLKKNDEGWLIISWFFMGLMGILTVTHKETRFITFLAPAMAILTEEGVMILIDAVEHFRPKTLGRYRTVLILALALLFLMPISRRAYDLKDTWNVVGKYDSDILNYAADHYQAEKLLVSPYLYTMAGFYYPDASVEMILYSNKTREKIARGYYDLIIYKEPKTYLNIEESGNYLLIKKFYEGKFKIYARREN
ncbi:ArnT family glycosyltransferase [Thermococcus piezophilus]|uniref:Glycosyltransferase n=1 Tax=Thermococcus piezophilus TaxID=1712654 RepID=A0A172WHY0_9EURY|nr:glycosyltransferase family 39 protein [Thermococcus piezophilus]ANF22916.1 glycosyltransferase [Thermococcus piezophilus]